MKNQTKKISILTLSGVLAVLSPLANAHITDWTKKSDQQNYSNYSESDFKREFNYFSDEQIKQALDEHRVGDNKRAKCFSQRALVSLKDSGKVVGIIEKSANKSNEKSTHYLVKTSSGSLKAVSSTALDGAKHSRIGDSVNFTQSLDKNFCNQ